MGDTLTVADAFGDHVVEFHFGPDWYQLRREAGSVRFHHRWRVDTYRGDGWSKWREISIANVRRWSTLPCKRVPITEAEQDPAGRWG